MVEATVTVVCMGCDENPDRGPIMPPANVALTTNWHGVK
jgi:hypothetical protein